MSKPPAGTYVIVNKYPSPNDGKLAITFNGSNQPLTANIRTDSPTQRWIIRDYDANTQSVTPVNATSLQAAWGSGYVTVLPAHNYVWTIRGQDNGTGYTIQDGGVTVFWGVAVALNNTNVTIGSATGNDKQKWLLERAQ